MVAGSNPASSLPAYEQDCSLQELKMLWQCCHCGGKIDDQEDNHEALEVQNEYGRIWHFYHPLCIDTLRSIERKLKELGTPEKSSLPKNVRSIKGAWTQA